MSSTTRVALRPPEVPPVTPLHNATVTLRARWPKSVLRDMDSAFDFTLGAMTAPRQEYERLKAEGKLSASGIAEKLREYSAHFVPKLRLAESLVEAGRQQLQQRRKQLTMPAIDKDDAVGISLRREARDYLRTLSPTQRQVVLSKNDPTFLAAIMEAPLELSGIDKETRDRIMDLHMKGSHKQELAHIAQREEAYDVLHSAVEFSKGEVRRYAGLAQHDREYDPSAPADKPAFLQTFDDWYESVPAPRSASESKAVDDIATLIRRGQDAVAAAVDRAAGW